MSDYELIFETPDLSPEQEEWIERAFEGFVGGHGETTLVTVECCGDDAVVAAQGAVEALRGNGIFPTRLYPDLVTRGAIAKRARVSPQAVGLWVRGERQTAQSFPKPYTLAGGGLWLWGEVNVWLRDAGLDADDVAYPTRRDHDVVNAWLSQGSHWSGRLLTVKQSAPRALVMHSYQGIEHVGWTAASARNAARISAR